MFSYLSRLFKQLSKSRWIQIYFSLVIIQTILSVSILAKTLANTQYVNQNLAEDSTTIDATTIGDQQNTIFGNYFTAKGYKIIYENVLFIVYETWRLWILTDGIVHLNSLTILASAWFSVFSCIFNVMLVVESRKWASYSFDPLKVENMRLQIALTVIFFALSFPVLITAYKSSKIIGWQIYKKIGSNIALQNMYHNVQRFALVLKVDIFFQVFLLIGAAIITERVVFRVICIIMTVLMSFSLVFSRIAITRESHWMMAIFLLLQLMLFACNIYSLIGLFEYSPADLWYIGIVYGKLIILVSILSIAFTIFLTIRCQISFGKGLKSFVQWYPFQSRKNTDNEPLHATEIGLLHKRNEERLPIDDDDDDYIEGLEIKKSLTEGKFNYNDISVVPRTSMERVEVLPYQVKVDRYQGHHKLNSIKLSKTTTITTDFVPRLAMQPILRSSSISKTEVNYNTTSNEYYSNSTILLESDIADNNNHRAYNNSSLPPYTETATVMTLLPQTGEKSAEG